MHSFIVIRCRIIKKCWYSCKFKYLIKIMLYIINLSLRKPHGLAGNNRVKSRLRSHQIIK